jgi:hypothetical protein
MIRRIFFPILVFFLLINDVQTTSDEYKRGQEAFQLLKETKQRVKHGIRMYYIFKRKSNIVLF